MLFLAVGQVVATNKYVCLQGSNPYHCYDIGRVESAIHTAFYPGSYPFAVGGIVHAAAALCFYLIKSHPFLDGNKRTATLVAISFLNQNGWDLRYPFDQKTERNALVSIIEGCASSKVNKEELMDWFDLHKIRC